jgi:PKD repeat protein
LLFQVVDFFDLPLQPGHVVANFLADTTMGYVPVHVSFTDISICDENNPIVSWRWDFDDDGTIDSEVQQPMWTYTEPGTYTVTLIVQNGIRSDTLIVPDLVTVGSFVSGTWQAAGSPYYVSQEIAVADGNMLVIEPGVEVIFTDHCGLRVEGTLLAVGTEQDSILFTAQDPDIGWDGINIFPGFIDDDSTKIEYVIVEHGWAKGGTQSLSSFGGGVTVDCVDEVLISHCTVRNNRASGYCPEWSEPVGGAISIRHASPTVNYNSIINNNAGDGGGISLHEASPLMVGNLIAGNTATRVGGAIAANENCDPDIRNNTISRNQAGLIGGALFLTANCNPVIRNTILWDNSADDGDQVGLLYNSCDPDFHYCDVEGGIGAFWLLDGTTFNGAYENCIDADPLFEDPQNLDFQLSWDNYPTEDSTKSPCIDAGDPDPEYNDSDGTRNDMGAFHFDQFVGSHGPSPGMMVFRLQQNRPNPFRPGGRGTRIEYSIPVVTKSGSIEIFNLAGQRVRKYQVRASAERTTDYVVWDGTDSVGSRIGSGIYLCRLNAGDRCSTRKMVLLP